MKAVLLAAGKGTRLRPLTDEMPKVMIPIGGKPILEHHVEHLAGAGIGEIFINLHHLPERITSHFGNGQKWGVRIRYSFEPEILGTAGAVKKLESELRGSPFLVVYGDNFSEFDFIDVRSDERIVRFLEKPAPNEILSHWVNAGIYRLCDDILDDIPLGYSDFGHDIFPEAIKRGRKLFAYRSKEPVWAIDHLELLDELSQREGT